jgi:signal transduction histidine kinase
MKYISILLLEDCKSYCDCLKEELKECDSESIKLNIHIANNTSEAKELLSVIDFNFIILDLNLSGEYGDDFIDYINNNTNSKIIVLTQNTDSKRRETLFEKNIIDYLSKKNHIIHIATDIIKTIEIYYDNFNKRILIVDSLVSSRKKLEKIFKNRNYKIVKVDDGNKALKVLQKKEFDLALIDIDTQIVTTDDVIYAIRSSRSNNQLPIIVFSNNDDYEDISRALKSGANEFIRKPYKLEDIILKTQRVLEMYSSQKRIELVNKELTREVQKAKKETQRRIEQEKLLIQQSRLAAMGEMIGNIAHQWKQPLTALNATIEDIEFKDRFNRLTKEIIKENVNTSKELIRYMAKTIDDFQDFFKPNKNKEFFMIADIIENNLSIISAYIKMDNITIQKSIPKDTKILGYKNELSQVLLNILYNAKDALIQNNINNKLIGIKIEHSKITFASGEEFITLPSINITICDNGGGIDEDIIEKIFDPYFTTKHKAQGTGIGLYMVKQIIENSFNGQITVSNGTINIDNKIYNGAKFLIKLPIASLKEVHF